MALYFKKSNYTLTSTKMNSSGAQAGLARHTRRLVNRLKHNKSENCESTPHQAFISSMAEVSRRVARSKQESFHSRRDYYLLWLTLATKAKTSSSFSRHDELPDTCFTQCFDSHK